MCRFYIPFLWCLFLEQLLTTKKNLDSSFRIVFYDITPNSFIDRVKYWQYHKVQLKFAKYLFSLMGFLKIAISTKVGLFSTYAPCLKCVPNWPLRIVNYTKLAFDLLVCIPLDPWLTIITFIRTLALSLFWRPRQSCCFWSCSSNFRDSNWCPLTPANTICSCNKYICLCFSSICFYGHLVVLEYHWVHGILVSCLTYWLKKELYAYKVN